MTTRLLLVPVLGLLVSGTPARVVAQSRHVTMLAEARDSIDQGAFGPALSLIEVVLKSPASLPADVRVRAYVLQGVTLTLMGGRNDEAADAFLEALSIDRSLTVDSLQSLSNQLLRIFQEAKAQLAQADSASLGQLEIRGLPPSGVQLAVDDTIWRDTTGDVAPGWRRITVTGGGYLPYRDSVLVDTAQSVVWVVNLVRAPLSLSVTIPDQVSVPATGAAYSVALVSARRSLVTVTLTGADGSLIRSDTETVNGRAEFGLVLRGPEGAILPAGRYRLRASGADDWGTVSEPVDQYITLSRGIVDTAPTPQPPAASSFLPETVAAHPGPVAPALGSVLLAAVTIAGPSLLGNPNLGSSATRGALAYAVGGTIGISGIVGFLSGKASRPSPENIRLNSQRRAEYARTLQEVTTDNARRRQEAPIIVRADRRAP
ncbi:MAG: hypothetical protein ABR998_08685 [Gemmatimonadales bacterium]|jgi:hypothetical protein